MVVNSDAETDFAVQVARELVGDDKVVAHTDFLMGSEDFAFMLQKRPGTFLRIGNGEGEDGCMVHNPHYDFNDRNLPIGAAYWSRLVERYLNSEAGASYFRPDQIADSLSAIPLAMFDVSEQMKDIAGLEVLVDAIDANSQVSFQDERLGFELVRMAIEHPVGLPFDQNGCLNPSRASVSTKSSRSMTISGLRCWVLI